MHHFDCQYWWEASLTWIQKNVVSWNSWSHGCGSNSMSIGLSISMFVPLFFCGTCQMSQTFRVNTSWASIHHAHSYSYSTLTLPTSKKTVVYSTVGAKVPNRIFQDFFPQTIKNQDPDIKKPPGFHASCHSGRRSRWSGFFRWSKKACRYDKQLNGRSRNKGAPAGNTDSELEIVIRFLVSPHIDDLGFITKKNGGEVLTIFGKRNILKWFKEQSERMFDVWGHSRWYVWENSWKTPISGNKYVWWISVCWLQHWFAGTHYGRMVVDRGNFDPKLTAKKRGFEVGGE